MNDDENGRYRHLLSRIDDLYSMIVEARNERKQIQGMVAALTADVAVMRAHHDQRSFFDLAPTTSIIIGAAVTMLLFLEPELARRALSILGIEP